METLTHGLKRDFMPKSTWLLLPQSRMAVKTKDGPSCDGGQEPSSKRALAMSAVQSPASQPHEFLKVASGSAEETSHRCLLQPPQIGCQCPAQTPGNPQDPRSGVLWGVYRGFWGGAFVVEAGSFSRVQIRRKKEIS